MIRFRVFGIKFEISFLLVCLLTLILILYDEYIFFAGLISVIFHELCHILFLIMFGIRIISIKFKLFEIIINQDKELPMYEKIIVLSVGLLGNLLLFFIFIFTKMKFFAILNLCLALFNMIPHEKLDGGQLLEIWLSNRFDLNSQVKILNFISMFVNIILFILGFVFILFFHNFTILIFSFILNFS